MVKHSFDIDASHVLLRLSGRVIGMGIDLMGARIGALRQLVIDCPPGSDDPGVAGNGAY